MLLLSSKGLTMRKLVLLILMMLSTVLASGKDVRGKVTYVAAGTIYTSIGAESGLKDSSLVYVVRGRDTVAVLQLMAMSSKSSSGMIVSSKSKISVGDNVVAKSDEPSSPAIVSLVQPDTLVQRSSELEAGLKKKTLGAPAVKIQGRVSAQYYTTFYEDASSNVRQPSLVLNLKASARDIPITFEMYGNYRKLSYGNSGSLFSPSNSDQSRLYRLTLQYNDGVNAVAVGRMVPASAPMIGYIDGILLSRMFGHLLVGTAAGFQSKSTLNGLNGDNKKIALFTGYQIQGPINMLTSASYTRNYFHSNLDREYVSGFLSLSSMSGLGVYFNSDVDFRQKKGDNLVFSPALTNLSANVSYPIVNFLALSVGADVSRSYSDYSLIRTMPDSLLDRTMRGGVSMGIRLFTTRGISFMNTYTPRSSPEGFGNDYSNNSTLMFSNVFSTGLMLRTSVNLSSNQYSSSKGIGVNVEKSIIDAVQLSLSYQHSKYTIKSLEETDDNLSYVIDALWFVSRDVSLSVNYNYLDGFGRISRNVFTELSYRF